MRVTEWRELDAEQLTHDFNAMFGRYVMEQNGCIALYQVNSVALEGRRLLNLKSLKLKIY